MPDASSPLPNARHEAFAVAYALKPDGSAAFRASGGKGNNAHIQGYKWLKKPGIRERIGWLKAEADRRLREEQARRNEPIVLTLMRKRIILATIAEDGVKDADRINAIKADNDLAGEGSEAEANKALSAVAIETLNRIFGTPA